MVDVLHSSLTGADSHEPKGVESATVGQVYIANGTGGGAWTTQINKYQLTVELTDVSTASSAYIVVPIAGTITSIYTVLHGAIATADAGITTEVNGVAVTGGDLTIAFTSSAAGDIDITSPSANKTVAIGDLLEVITDGASTNTIRATVVFIIQE